MDIRGIEITNQLRSAIRAKLLELGVRYDEELPDYILVMVVNKKSRQQMHEDLFLFLEDSTTPFVEWLHDQVLKKLQKVTVAKRKSSRDLIPSVVVKQEEERKKRKTATSFLDDQTPGLSDKDDKQQIQASIQLVSSTTSQDVEQEKTPERQLCNIENPPETRLSFEEEQNEPEVSSSKEKFVKEKDITKNVSKPSPSIILTESKKEIKKVEEKQKTDIEENNGSISDNEGKKLKSSVSKPKITSVVSVKTRLGNAMSKKKFEGPKDRGNFGSNRIREDRRPVKNEHRIIFPRNQGLRGSDADYSKKNDLRNRLDNMKPQEKFSALKSKEKLDIRERLGQSNVKSKVIDSEKERNFMRKKSIKNRLGPIKTHCNDFNHSGIIKTKDKELDNDEIVGPIKSRIIAVKNPTSNKEIKKNNKSISDDDMEETECKVSSKVIVTPRPLKPLQPVQKRATQSLLLRAVAEANQSVVMQKNPEPSMKEKRPVPVHLKTSGLQEIGNSLSVRLNQKNRFVMEKIQIELSTEGDKFKKKDCQISEVTDEHLGVVKSLFQRGDNNHTFLVTLNGYNNEMNKEYVDEEEEEEEEGGEEEEEEEEEDVEEQIEDINDEGLEMEVNENDEMTLSSSQFEYIKDDSCLNVMLPKSIITTDINEELITIDNKQENQNNKNIEEKISKKRKLSPIIYTRSPSPKDVSIKLGPISPTIMKKPMIDTNVLIITDKSKEKCRYWPNCTLGNKCAYYHPILLCSAFPACKFGDKCVYQHPKCKYGVCCTKIGCVFSHPLKQCKFHPFCTKPGCIYLHPTADTISVTNSTKQRAKFTWKRQD